MSDELQLVEILASNVVIAGDILFHRRQTEVYRTLRAPALKFSGDYHADSYDANQDDSVCSGGPEIKVA